MRIPPYFLETASHSILHFRLEERRWHLDRNKVLRQAGLSLGILRI
jgi:hypothetical protein